MFRDNSIAISHIGKHRTDENQLMSEINFGCDRIFTLNITIVYIVGMVCKGLQLRRS